MNPAEETRYRRNFLRWFDRQEVRNARVVTSWLTSVEHRVTDALERLGVARTLSNVGAFIPPAPVRVLIGKLYQNTVIDAARRELSRLRILTGSPAHMDSSLEAGFFSPRWQVSINTMLSDKVTASRITGITQATRDQVRAVLVDANARNLSVRETAANLTPVLSGNKKRALLIARTETTRAASAGAEAAAMSSLLVLQKKWVATVDSRTRPSHLAMLSAKPVARDGTFLVDGLHMKYPGDPAGGAANVCNCRCSVVYVPAKIQD